MKSMNFNEAVTEDFVRITDPNTIVGKGSMMPHNAANSGPRKDMHSVQVEHIYPLLDPEVAYHQTGRENRFAQFSSAYQKNEMDYYVVAKIRKFSFEIDPKYDHYFMIVQKRDGSYHVIERKCYEHVTESYGFLYNNKNIDIAQPGQVIPADTTIKKSLAFDDFDNRQDGVNAQVIYQSTEKSKEDAIEIRKGFAPRLASPEICPITIMVNDNDVPLNLYGDRTFYHSFANVGQPLKNSIVCGLRKERKDQALYSLSVDRMMDITMSDTKYLVLLHDPVIVDIDIYCNNPTLLDKFYNAQLKFYYEEKLRFARELIELLKPLKEEQHAKFSPELQKLYYVNESLLSGKQYTSDKVFSNVIIEITVLGVNPLEEGDKLANRYGGKGCISRIVPDELMPLMPNGKRADIRLNTSGVPNRENAGQLFEQSINMRAEQLVEYIVQRNVKPIDALQMIADFLSIVSPKMASKYEDVLLEVYDIEGNMDLYSTMPGYDNAIMEARVQGLLSSIIEDGIIMTVVEPITETMSLKILRELDNMFRFFRQDHAEVKIKDSNGNYRPLQTRKPISMGYQYIYRLKQYAKEKFSVTSLCSTNLKNEPAKSSDKKSFKVIHSSTPIRFGEMETSDLGHLGFEHVITNLMLNSASPHGRRLAKQLLTGDPYDIDIKLDDIAKNRGVEGLNAYLVTMGLELKFVKKRRVAKHEILFRGIEFKVADIRRAIEFDVQGVPMIGYVDKVFKAAESKITFEGITFNDIEEENKEQTDL